MWDVVCLSVHQSVCLPDFSPLIFPLSFLPSLCLCPSIPPSLLPLHLSFSSLYTLHTYIQSHMYVHTYLCPDILQWYLSVTRAHLFVQIYVRTRVTVVYIHNCEIMGIHSIRFVHIFLKLSIYDPKTTSLDSCWKQVGAQGFPMTYIQSIHVRTQICSYLPMYM